MKSLIFACGLLVVGCAPQPNCFGKVVHVDLTQPAFLGSAGWVFVATNEKGQRFSGFREDPVLIGDPVSGNCE